MRLNIKRFAIEASNDTKLTAPVSSTYKYTLSVSFTENSTSTANNTSNITCTASIGAQYVSYNVSNGGTLEIYWHDNRNNSDTLLDSITVEQCGNGGGAGYGTKSVTATTNVTHKDDGTLSGYAKAVFIKNKTNSYIPASGEVSTSNTALTTIPRASSISATTANIGSASTITINRASNSFTHTVTYSFNNGAVSGTVATKTSSTSLSLTLPTTLYAQIPNSNEINGTLTCITYSGDTEIGRQTGTIKATVPSTAKPTVSVPTLTDTDTVSKNTIQVYVQGKSKLQFNFTNCFSSSYSATLKLYTLKINGTQVYSDNQSTYTMTTPLPNTTNTYELIVTDSRGLTATTGEKTIIAYAYAAPTCSISAERNSSTPTTVVIKYSGTITNINNNNRNAKSFVIEYRQSGSSSWTSVTSATDSYVKTNVTVNKTGVSDSNSFEFRITATDSYNVPATATVSIGTSATLINFNANGQTLAFGKASEIADTMEFDIKAKFLKDVEFTGAVNQIGTLSNLTTTAKTDVVSAINEVNETNIMIAGITNDITLDTYLNYNITTLDTTPINYIGNKLTLSSTGITIGAGVSKIKISANGLYTTIVNSASPRYLKTKINNTEVGNCRQSYNGAGTGLTLSLSPKLYNVQQGDVISFAIQGDAGDVFRASSIFTYFCVEVVK